MTPGSDPNDNLKKNAPPRDGFYPSHTNEVRIRQYKRNRIGKGDQKLFDRFVKERIFRIKMFFVLIFIPFVIIVTIFFLRGGRPLSL